MTHSEADGDRATYAAPLSDRPRTTWCPVCRVVPIRQGLLTCSRSCSATQRHRREYLERRRAAGLPMWCSWVGCVQPMQAGDRTRDGRDRLFCSSCTALHHHTRSSPHLLDGMERRDAYQRRRSELLGQLLYMLQARIPANPCVDCGEESPPGKWRCTMCGQAAALRQKERRRDYQRGMKYGHKLEDLVQRNGGTCGRCGCVVTVPWDRHDRRSAERDHIIPRSLAPELLHCTVNIQLLCMDCNRAKGDTVTPEDVRTVMDRLADDDHRLQACLRVLKQVTGCTPSEKVSR